MVFYLSSGVMVFYLSSGVMVFYLSSGIMVCISDIRAMSLGLLFMEASAKT